MTLYELAALVREVRRAQVTYFQARNQDNLVRSKTLERRLDTALESIAQEEGALTPVLPEERPGFRRHWFVEEARGPNPSVATLRGFRFVLDEKGYAVVRPELLNVRAFLMEIEEEKWLQINMRW